MERLYTAIITNAKTLDTDVGSMLRIINTCENMHVLPTPGGLFEQDALFMYIYDYVGQVRATRAELDKYKKQPSS